MNVREASVCRRKGSVGALQPQHQTGLVEVFACPPGAPVSQTTQVPLRCITSAQKPPKKKKLQTVSLLYLCRKNTFFLKVYRHKEVEKDTKWRIGGRNISWINWNVTRPTEKQQDDKADDLQTRILNALEVINTNQVSRGWFTWTWTWCLTTGTT